MPVSKFGPNHSNVLLRNGNLTAVVSTLGATLLSVKHHGKELTLNYWDAPSAEAYQKCGPRFYGCIAGRFANRIRKGQFSLDGVNYSLPINNGVNSLHGGKEGFDKKTWTLVEEGKRDDKVFARFSYISADNEEGYPGEFTCEVTYTLTTEDQLEIAYNGKTTKACPVNLTNHAYWNLSGDCVGTIYDHTLQLHCDKYLPVDDTQIPLGEEKDVANTPFDYTVEGGKLLSSENLSKVGNGLDHCFCTHARDNQKELVKVARLECKSSNRYMEVYSDQPGVQVYSCNNLSKEPPHAKHYALCLETQAYPNAPNQSNFPNCILRPGEEYTHRTIHRFGTVSM
eukprot:g6359.t1